MVAAADVVSDRPYQFADAAEGSAPDPLVGDFSEEAFHEIQPGSAGGREVLMIVGIRPKLGLHRRISVGAIVVQDEMDRHPPWNAVFDALEKPQKNQVAMARQLRRARRAKWKAATKE